MVETLGAVAAVLTTGAFLPQAIRSLRTRDTAGLSLWTWVMFEAGVFCWLLYGVGIGSTPVIWANAITLVFAGAVLAVKLHNVRTGVDRARAAPMSDDVPLG